MADLRIPVWTVAERMMKARTSAGITREEMADVLVRSRNTILNYETGRTEPTIRVLRRWAEVTEVPMDWLLNGDAVRTGSYSFPLTRTLAIDLRRWGIPREPIPTISEEIAA